MKKQLYILITICLAISCGEPPIQFSKESLTEELITLNGKSTSLEQVLDAHKGKTVLIDVWASWCGDCIKGMPKVREIQETYKDVDYVFLSVDIKQGAWKRGIDKYDVVGDHYFVTKGQKGALGEFLNSNWIPRYMVIDKEGSIKLFKAKNANDKRITEALN